MRVYKMMRAVEIGFLVTAAAGAGWAVEPAPPAKPATATPSADTSAKGAKKPAAKKQTAPAKKKYRSSSGGPAKNGPAKPGSAKTGPAQAAARTRPSAKTASAKTTAPAKAPVKSPGGSAAPAVTQTAAIVAQSSATTTAARPVRRFTPSAPAVTRVAAHEAVFQNVSNAADIPVENAAALIPFFEQLYRHQKGEIPGPLRILHYGDSHTAADEWTGELRTRFQERFGDGGSGYSFAGRPWNGYRREDVRTGSTRGWHTDGLVGRAGDGIYGLGGVSMTVKAPREAVYLEADCAAFELFFYQQPDGGSLELYDNGMPVDRVTTGGAPGPGYYRFETVPGPHKFELETLDHGPVRLFGWVAENPTGVTYEPLGINGASASIVFGWDEATLRSNIERRNPGLIVLAYGTNEAGHKDTTLESYRTMFSQLIARFRAAAPTATILVIGPPDRYVRTRKGWQPLDGVDTVVEAQREAALANGCPFWDLRAKMGGKGSMQQWISAGMAQLDHVHFTAPGYRLLGDAVFRDLMSQYEVFVKARADIIAGAAVTETAALGEEVLDPGQTAQAAKAAETSTTLLH
jgi:lysophospholipase L1-like esterase